MVFMIYWKARCYTYKISEYHFTLTLSILKYIYNFNFSLRELSRVNLKSIRSLILIIEISYKVSRAKIILDTRSIVVHMFLKHY